MKKKGFTLIELLAVIVILGIITVIAVPKILDVVNKTKDSAADSSLKLVKDAIKTQIASSDLTGDLFTQESDGCYIFDFDDQSIGNSKKLNIKKAILKEGSPSCGVNYIYDGNFNGTKKPGRGITAKILKEASIEVISEKDLGGNINGYI